MFVSVCVCDIFCLAVVSGRELVAEAARCRSSIGGARFGSTVQPRVVGGATQQGTAMFT